MTPAQQRRLWAMIGSQWDKGIGEYILYATMIAKWGKCSIKALTHREIDDLFTWLEALGGDNAGTGFADTETRRQKASSVPVAGDV